MKELGEHIGKNDVVVRANPFKQKRSERIVRAMEILDKLDCGVECPLWGVCGDNEQPCTTLMEELEAEAQDAREKEQVEVLERWLTEEVNKDE